MATKSRRVGFGRPRPRAIALASAAALLLGAGEGSAPGSELLRRIEETGVAQARRAIAQGAALTPFAFVVRSDGRTQRVSPPKKRRRRGESAFDTLVAGLRAKATAGDYQAIALFRFVVISLPGGDEATAIQVGVEDVQGHCADSFIPYRNGDDDGPEFDPPISTPPEARFFPRCRGNDASAP